jgi:hypothetical protein
MTLANPSNNSTGGSGGPGPLITNVHYWYGVVYNGAPTGAHTGVFFNVTTPQSPDQTDALFDGVSVWDESTVYFQMGIVGASPNNGQSWACTGGSCQCNSAVGYGSSQWCAYVSFISYNYFTCAQSVTAYEFNVLTPNTKYSFKAQWNSGTISYSGSGIGTGAYTDGANGFFILGQISPCLGRNTDDFTVYEEIYDTNPVQAWPAFNLHSDVEVPGFSSWSWGTVSQSTPSGFPGQWVAGWQSGIETVNIDNERFAIWVGNPFFSGIYTFSKPSGWSGKVTVGLNAVLDPANGYSVTLQYNYVTLPARWVSFTVNPLTVPNGVYWYIPTGYMVVTVPTGTSYHGTFTMAVYAVDSATGSAISYWYFDFT